MTRRMRRLVLGGTMTSGLILCVASAAFACTVYWGELTGTGNGTGNVAQSVLGDPRNSGTFQYCGTYSYTTNETTRASSWTIRTADSSPSLTLTVNAAEGCNDGGEGFDNVLPEGDYYVGVSNGFWAEDGDDGEDNCHTLLTSSGPGYGDIIDPETFSVNSSGYGTETYSGATLNNAVGLGWNVACVFLDAGAFSPANSLNFKSV